MCMILRPGHNATVPCQPIEREKGVANVTWVRDSMVINDERRYVLPNGTLIINKVSPLHHTHSMTFPPACRPLLYFLITGISSLPSVRKTCLLHYLLSTSYYIWYFLIPFVKETAFCLLFVFFSVLLSIILRPIFSKFYLLLDILLPCIHHYIIIFLAERGKFVWYCLWCHLRGILLFQPLERQYLYSDIYEYLLQSTPLTATNDIIISAST